MQSLGYCEFVGEIKDYENHFSSPQLHVKFQHRYSKDWVEYVRDLRGYYVRCQQNKEKKQRGKKEC